MNAPLHTKVMDIATHKQNFVPSCQLIVYLDNAREIKVVGAHECKDFLILSYHMKEAELEVLITIMLQSSIMLDLLLQTILA